MECAGCIGAYEAGEHGVEEASVGACSECGVEAWGERGVCGEASECCGEARRRDEEAVMGEVIELATPGPMPDGARRLLRYARETVDLRGSDLTGFVIIAWGELGTTTSGQVNAQRNVPRELLPAYVAEVVRRDFVTKDEIEEQMIEAGILTRPPA